MTEQLALFALPQDPPLDAVDPRKMARRSDPSTSLEAAQDAAAAGEIRTQRREVLALVRANPGLTSRELAAVSGVNRHVIARRLPELERLGLLEKGAKRPCTAHPRNIRATTWWPRPAT